MQLLVGALGAALALSAASAAPMQAQKPIRQAPTLNNVTGLDGTWSSGSGNVTTGLQFFNPSNAKFNIPSVTGISYSFTQDGFFEQAKYTYTSNATVHRCVKASLIWQHGKYTINSNGSISLLPWKSDGKVMVLDVCARDTIQQYYYFQQELIPLWYNFIESDAGTAPWADTKQNADPAFALQMFQNGGDGKAGQKIPVMYLQARPPNMLPTQPLMENVLNPAATGGKSSSAGSSNGGDEGDDGLDDGAWRKRQWTQWLGNPSTPAEKRQWLGPTTTPTTTAADAHIAVKTSITAPSTPRPWGDQVADRSHFHDDAERINYAQKRQWTQWLGNPSTPVEKRQWTQWLGNPSTPVEKRQWTQWLGNPSTPVEKRQWTQWLGNPSTPVEKRQWTQWLGNPSTPVEKRQWTQWLGNPSTPVEKRQWLGPTTT